MSMTQILKMRLKKLVLIVVKEERQAMVIKLLDSNTMNYLNNYKQQSLNQLTQPKISLLQDTRT